MTMTCLCQQCMSANIPCFSMSPPLKKSYLQFASGSLTIFFTDLLMEAFPRLLYLVRQGNHHRRTLLKTVVLPLRFIRGILILGWSFYLLAEGSFTT